MVSNKQNGKTHRTVADISPSAVSKIIRPAMPSVMILKLVALMRTVRNAPTTRLEMDALMLLFQHSERVVSTDRSIRVSSTPYRQDGHLTHVRGSTMYTTAYIPRALYLAPERKFQCSL